MLVTQDTWGVPRDPASDPCSGSRGHCPRITYGFFFENFSTAGEPPTASFYNQKSTVQFIYKQIKRRESKRKKSKANYNKLSIHDDKESISEDFTLCLRRVTWCPNKAFHPLKLGRIPLKI
jgi:hypothetical protein